MKKIIALILLVIIVIGGVFGYNYYQKTYASHVAYAKIPDQIPIKTETKDDRGETLDNLFSYNYELTFIDEKGVTQKLSYEISSDNPEPLEPNSYVKADISSTRITNEPTTISKDDIPKNVAEKLAAE